MSNINLNTTINSGNTGKIGTSLNPGIIRGVVMVPIGTTIPATAMVSQSAFSTYVTAKFIADNRADRWFAFTNLDKFEDLTKATSVEDTGRLQLAIYDFPGKFSFRYMQGIGNFIEARQFQNCQGTYDYFFIDDSGNWWGTKGSTYVNGAMAAVSNQQFYVMPWKQKTTTTDNQFMLSIQLAEVEQMNSNVLFYQANYAADSIVMLQNAVLNDVTAVLGTPLSITTTTTKVFTVKVGQNSLDWVKKYLSSITASCFVAYNNTTGAAATIASITKGNIVVAGQSYWYIAAVLSGAPTASDEVRFGLAAPSVVNGIVTNANVVCELINPSQDGANWAVGTF